MATMDQTRLRYELIFQGEGMTPAGTQQLAVTEENMMLGDPVPEDVSHSDAPRVHP